MEDRNYEEHEKIFDKIGELTVVVAVLSNEMGSLKDTVNKTCDSVDELKDTLIKDSTTAASGMNDKLFGLLKYIVIALLAGTVGAGSISAFTGKVPVDSEINQSVQTPTH